MEIYEPYQVHKPLQTPPIATNCSQVFRPFPFRGQVHTASLAVCTVLVIFVLVMGCVGNGIVLLSALKWKKLRTHFDVLILNLAGADFLTCTCLAPIFLFLLFADPETPVTFCGSVLFMGTMSGMLSILTVVVIALHRLARVIGRTKRSLTLRRTGIILGFIWILSLSISLGGTFHVTFDWNDQLGTCQAIINSPDRWSKNFVLFFVAPVVITSFVIITLSYVAICWSVQNQGKSLGEASPIHSCRYAGDGKYKQNGQFLRDNNIKRGSAERHCYSCSGNSVLNNENKAFAMCLVVILTIGLCWGPLIVSQFVELATGESLILYQVKLCGIALVFLNSALDPYIYAQHIGQMKQRYGKAFQSVIKCASSDNNSSRLTSPRQCNLTTTKDKLRHSKDNCNAAPLAGANNIKKLLECVTTTSKPNNSALKSVYSNNLLIQSPKIATNGTFYLPFKKHLGKGVFFPHSNGVVNASCSQATSKESQSLMEEHS